MTPPSEEVKKRFLERIGSMGIEMTGEYRGTAHKVRLRCKEGHEWESQPITFVRSKPCGGCRKCSGGGRRPDVDRLYRVLESKRLLRLGDYAGTLARVDVRCLECGKEFGVVPKEIVRRNVGRGCGNCASIARKRPNVVEDVVGGLVRVDVTSEGREAVWMIIERPKWDELIEMGISRVSLSSKGYPWVNLEGEREYVHRLLTGRPQAPEQVDHINGIKTDNRMSNLRVVTARENQMNRGLRKTNTSGVIGVHEKKPGVWEACLKVNHKTAHRSLHKTKEEAAAARAEAVRLYCGEFAPIL